MRVRDEQKHKRICEAAARLFAQKRFHEVRLEDIAAEAGVGKGTLYLYCQSKQDLFVSLLDEAFAGLVERLQSEVPREASGRDKLRLIVRSLVDYAFENPHLFELMRTVGVPAGGRPVWERKRQELAQLIQETITQGAREGVMQDDCPALTATYLMGMVRSMMLYGPRTQSREQVARHMMRFVEAGLSPRSQA